MPKANTIVDEDEIQALHGESDQAVDIDTFVNPVKEMLNRKYN